MNAVVRHRIKQILPFGVIWLVIGWGFLIIEYLAIPSQEFIPETAIRLNPAVLLFASVLIFIMGLGIGLLETLVVRRWFLRKSFGQKIVMKFLFYGFILSLVVIIAFPIARVLESGPLEKDLFQQTLNFIKSRTFFSTILQLNITLLLSLFFNEISNHLGRETILHLLTGKYHTPKTENRVFLFADMKSSTTIAEKLGHHQYFLLLKEYYHLLSEALIHFDAEVFQYVGDEIVISWRPSDSYHKEHYLACFSSMKQSLREKETYLQQRFGILPDFKGAFHFGEVSTGEIGSLKKELIFTGDTLNTTARIQELCSQYNQDLLFSEEFRALAGYGAHEIVSLGTLQLKGKVEQTTVYTRSEST